MANYVKKISGKEVVGSGGIPEPTTSGNWLRTNVGTWVEGVLKSAYDLFVAKYPVTATNGKILQGNGTTYVEVDTPSGSTNLSITNRTTTTLDVASNTGTDATIPESTTSLSGLISSADKTKLDTVATNANVGVVPNTAITGATKTKITYDSKGLVTSGADATPSDIGLGNVDNTSDVNKPVSTAQSTAINAKVTDAIVDGVTTIAPSQNAVFDALSLKADKQNGLTSGGLVTVGTFGGTGTNNDIRVSPATWYINPNTYTTVINTDFLDIALSSAGNQRYVGLYCSNTGVISKVEGTEAALASYPTTPANNIVIGYVLVGDAVVDTTPDLSGYMLKSDKASQASNVTGTNDTTYVTPLANAIKQNTASKDASGGYVGLTLFSINFKNVANTFTSFFTNINTAARTYTFQNRNGTIADDTDLATKQATLVSATNIKTINGSSVLGSGDLTVTGFTAASVAEINTGSEPAKGATPLNLEGSKYMTQYGQKTYAIASGTNTYTLTLSPAITSYADGMELKVKFTNAPTGSSTFNVNGVGAKKLFINATTQVISASFLAGQQATVRYDTTLDTGAGGWLMVKDAWWSGIKTVSQVFASSVNFLMPANTIKGNNTGSSATSTDLTTDQVTAMMEVATAVATTGIITAMTSATFKYIRLTSASATGLGSIVAPSSSYKDLYVWNDTGVSITLYHEYVTEATAANRILCGANRSWANNTMLHLKYDVAESRWCTVVQDGNTFRALLAGTGVRIVQADATGQESASVTTQDVDFTGGQQTSATGGSWTGVNEITISGLKQGQIYVDISGGFRYECHANDKCSRTPVINTANITTNLIYPCSEITATSGSLIVDNAFVTNNASRVDLLLPSTATQGDVIIINGKGAGGWGVTQNASQQIVGGLTNTTVGATGYIRGGQYAAVTLKCITGGSSTIWEIVCVNPATTLTIF